MKFRRKNEVDAIQWTGGNLNEVTNFIKAFISEGDLSLFVSVGVMRINAPIGPFVVIPGDWIVRDANGEFYPCKLEVFYRTYEEIL
jgi:hypothetical protein